MHAFIIILPHQWIMLVAGELWIEGNDSTMQKYLFGRTISMEVQQLNSMRQVQSPSQSRKQSIQQFKTHKWSRLCIGTALLLFLTGLFLYFDKGQYSPGKRILGDQSSIEKAKEEYRQQLSSFFDEDWQLNGLELVESNFAYAPSSYINQLEQKEYQRLNKQHRFDLFHKELPFCMIVQRLNILDGFSYQLTLNSIFNQNYSNYKAIILHQPQTRGYQIVQNYLQQNNINPQNYIHVLNHSPKSILQTIYDATHQYCSPESISFPIHRSGELIGRNVLKTYNVLYQINNVGLIYSNYYRYSRSHYVKVGANYHNFEKQLNNIRREVVFITNAVTYRTSFFLAIPKADLLGDGYTYYDIVYEQALFFPLVQMMCGLVFKIDQFFLLTKEPFEDYDNYLQFVEKQKENSQIFRNKVRLPCNQTYARETRSTFFITSLDKHQLDIPQLAEISGKSCQDNARIKHSIKSHALLGNLGKAMARKADKYIYNGSYEVSELKHDYQMVRLDYCDAFHEYQSPQLSKYNMYLGRGVDEKERELLNKYEGSIEKMHQVSLYSKYEVPLCIVLAQLPSWVDEYRFQFVLNSIFAQEYSNFFVVINNRNPSLDKFVRKYLHHYQISKDKYAYIEHPHTTTPLQAIHKSLTQTCHNNSYALVMSGKEELLGRMVFKVLNSKFRQNRFNLLYTNGYIFHQEEKNVEPISSSNYSLKEKKDNLYRHIPIKYSNLVAFKAKMIWKVKPTDLQDSSGQYLLTNWEEALYFPLLQLSCSLNAQIEGGHYIRHKQMAEREQYSSEVSQQIRNLTKYPCFVENTTESKEVEEKATPIDPQKPKVQRQGAAKGTSYTPLDLLQLDNNGQGIAQQLYSKYRYAISKREQHHNRRERASEKSEGTIGVQLTMFNLKLDHSLDTVEEALVAEEYKRVSAATSHFSKEYPICVVIDLQFSQPLSQFQYTLNSLFLQNYTNYFAVVFGDGSENGNQILRRYFDFYDIPSEKYTFIANENNSSGLQNIVMAARSYCSKDSLMLYMRESDEFAGRNVLKLLSWTFDKQASPFIYSSYLLYDNQTLKQVSPLVEQKDLSIRKAKTFRLSFAAFTSQLFRKIDTSNFKDEEGAFIKDALDKALFLPMIEMACSKAYELKGTHFLRTITKKMNQSGAEGELKLISEKKALSCLSQP